MQLFQGLHFHQYLPAAFAKRFDCCLTFDPQIHIRHHLPTLSQHWIDMGDLYIWFALILDGDSR